jgi:hypothetical protein
LHRLLGVQSGLAKQLVAALVPEAGDRSAVAGRVDTAAQDAARGVERLVERQ